MLVPVQQYTTAVPAKPARPLMVGIASDALVPASGPRSRGARVHPRPQQGRPALLRSSAASGLVLATQKLDGITGRALATLVGQIVEEVRACQHPDRLAFPGDDDRIRSPGQRREH